MVESFARNSIYFTLKLHLLLVYVCAFISNERNSDQMYGLVNTRGVIILKNFNESIHNSPDVRQYFFDKFSKRDVLCFELYPNFTFNLDYFNNILNEDDLMIRILFNEELKELVISSKIKSSQYVNIFLAYLAHKENIKKMDLSSLNLTEIPRMIYEFKNLEMLDLGYNKLENLELDWNSLRNLKFLCLCFGEKITEIVESLFNLPSLTILQINCCAVTEIPDYINKLENLEHLDVSSGNLKTFPGNLSGLKKLKSISIIESSIEKLTINMGYLPDLGCLGLARNHSLKYMILILEIPQKMFSIKTYDCFFEEIEVCLNLENTKFSALNRGNQQSEDFDYVIRFVRRNEFIGSYTNQILSNRKNYTFHIDTSNEFDKTVTINKFNLEKTKTFTRDELINRWIGICNVFNLESNTELHDEYIHSIEFIKSLYKNDSDDCSDWTTSLPFEYKEKVTLILIDLFDQLENESSESHIKSILKIFKRPVSEQLIFFNYLLKYSKPCSREKDCFVAFVRESIEILKNFAFTTCLNLEKYEYGVSLNSLNRYVDENFNMSRQFDNDRVYKGLIMFIIDAKKNFDSKFTVDYFSEIIGNVMARIDDPELFNNEKMVESSLENWEARSEFFEYEKKGNVSIIKKPSSLGMKVLISLIVTGQMPIPNE